MKWKLPVETICCMLVGLLLYTGIRSFLDFNSFTDAIKNQIFPDWMKPILVWLLPISEILISVFLMKETTRQSGLWMAFVLLSGFSFYAGSVYYNLFDRLPCTCFGVIDSFSWGHHFYFYLTFTLLSLTGVLLIKKSQIPGHPKSHTAMQH